MFFVFGRHVQVGLLGTGRFWCLYCEDERPYQKRAWSSTALLFVAPVQTSRGVFVFCPVCESAFDPQCLDESSTATCDELMMQVPLAALRERVRVQRRPMPVLDVDIDAAEEPSEFANSDAANMTAPESRAERQSLKGLSARSASRRH